MYVGVIHEVKDMEVMASRGEGWGIPATRPPGTRPRQFFPSVDGSAATCLWEADSMLMFRSTSDTTLGDSSEQIYFEVSSAARDRLARDGCVTGVASAKPHWRAPLGGTLQCVDAAPVAGAAPRCSSPWRRRRRGSRPTHASSRDKRKPRTAGPPWVWQVPINQPAGVGGAGRRLTVGRVPLRLALPPPARGGFHS